MYRIDLNCDMGESYGPYTIGADEAVMELITSANIACGFHAGDPQVMRQTVRLAKAHGVAVGAHPGFPDRVGFGRRPLHCSPEELYTDVLYQIGALAAICRAEEVALRHVKPHGALYNMANREPELAHAIATAVAAYDPGLLLFALPHSALQRAGEQVGLRVVREGFADRAYNPDGSLVARARPGAVLHEPDAVAHQALRLIQEGRVTAQNGGEVLVPVESLCIHGDNPEAVSLLQRLRTDLVEAGVTLAAP